MMTAKQAAGWKKSMPSTCRNRPSIRLGRGENGAAVSVGSAKSGGPCPVGGTSLHLCRYGIIPAVAGYAGLKKVLQNVQRPRKIAVATNNTTVDIVAHCAAKGIWRRHIHQHKLQSRHQRYLQIRRRARRHCVSGGGSAPPGASRTALSRYYADRAAAIRQDIDCKSPRPSRASGCRVPIPVAHAGLLQAWIFDPAFPFPATFGLFACFDSSISLDNVQAQNAGATTYLIRTCECRSPPHEFKAQTRPLGRHASEATTPSLIRLRGFTLPPHVCGLNHTRRYHYSNIFQTPFMRTPARSRENPSGMET